MNLLRLIAIKGVLLLTILATIGQITQQPVQPIQRFDLNKTFGLRSFLSFKIDPELCRPSSCDCLFKGFSFTQCNDKSIESDQISTKLLTISGPLKCRLGSPSPFSNDQGKCNLDGLKLQLAQLSRDFKNEVQAIRDECSGVVQKGIFSIIRMYTMINIFNSMTAQCLDQFGVVDESNGAEIFTAIAKALIKSIPGIGKVADIAKDIKEILDSLNDKTPEVPTCLKNLCLIKSKIKLAKGGKVEGICSGKKNEIETCQCFMDEHKCPKMISEDLCFMRERLAKEYTKNAKTCCQNNLKNNKRCDIIIDI